MNTEVLYSELSSAEWRCDVMQFKSELFPLQWLEKEHTSSQKKQNK